MLREKGMTIMLTNLWNDKRKRFTLLAIAAVAVVALAATGGWMAWDAHALSVAKTDCAKAANNVRVSANEYDALVNGDAETASAITKEQVRDGKTVETLAKALKAKAPEYGGCVADDEQGLQDATAKLNAQAKWYNSHETSLSKAVKAVSASKLEKTIDSANALLRDSDGKVQDNATRDELSKAIETKEEQAIATATTKVNDSIAAKTKADEEAKRKAEEEAAAAAAAAQAASQQQSYSSYSYGSTGSYSGGASSSSGSSSSGSSSNGSSSGGSSEGFGVAFGVGAGSDPTCTRESCAPIRR